MADVQTQSPEATYATKGNIVVQKAYSIGRTVTDIADGTTNPNAEGVIEDHLPSGAGIVNASMTAFAGDGGSTGV
jgi:hypothetical protein